MTTAGDPRTRIVLSWLREDLHENAERVLLRALDDVDTTPQRRSWWPTWRFSPMHSFIKWAAAAAAVLLLAVVGYQLLPGTGASGGGQPIVSPTPSPSPTPMPLARGTFKAKGADTVLEATGAGDRVTGTMAVDHGTGAFTVDLQCSRTAEDGRILIAGDTTESTSMYATKDTRTAIVLKPGSPVYAVFEFELPGRAAASCLEFLDGMIDDEFASVIGPDALEPIRGTVELGP